MNVDDSTGSSNNSASSGASPPSSQAPGGEASGADSISAASTLPASQLGAVVPSSLAVLGNDRDHTLPPELRALVDEIQVYARDFGLDFFPTLFEMLDYDEINMVAARGGFPTRYPHWRFGMGYEELSKGYTYGLQKIYEMVINNNPCYAYLLKCNALVDQKLVIGHVYGHCDFFKNNMWFAHTNRKMLDQMANHATKVRRYIERFGAERVEIFIDACLSLENLIDYHAPYIKRRPDVDTRPASVGDEEEPAHGEGIDGIYKLRTDRRYMDSYINPPEFIESQRQKLKQEAEKARRFPEDPERDILWFLLNYAPLEHWEREVLNIIRDEAYYFAPQGMTKIMNEGWASYWHTTIMTQKAMTASEVIDYADHHSGTMAMQPGSLNPYKIGIELYRDIEERWNKGQFGREWDECYDQESKRRWDKQLGLGRQKIFEVRRIYNDVTFLDAFLTEDFCHKHKLFIYDYDPRSNHYQISSRKFSDIKKRLLSMMTNFGNPRISVVDGNHANRGELHLVHEHEGVDLKVDYAVDTLKHLVMLWRRPASLETVVDGRRVVMSHDGREFKSVPAKR